MIRRSLCACLSAAAFGTLVATAHVVAKPPDLPKNETITVTPKIGDDEFGDMPTYEVESWFNESSHKELDWVKWVAVWYGAPKPERNEGYVQAKDDITCPFLRQQQKQKTDPRAYQFADPEIGRDVLDNLERLKQVDDLIKTAKSLAEAGRIVEAMKCCVHAEELCPGSPSADRAAALLFDLCFSEEQTERGSEESAEEPSETPEDSQAQDESQREIGLKLKAELDLIAAEWERIWFGDGPSHLTAECPPPGDIIATGTPCRKRSAFKKSIEEKLCQPVSVNFTNTPLCDALEYLRTDRGINIYVDEPALAEKGICIERPITVKLEGISLQSLLNLIVRSAGLRYLVKEEVVLITTEEHACGKLQQRTYAVADLLEYEDLLKNCAISGTDKNASPEDRLIAVITGTISPRSWSEMGGNGTIDYYPLSRSLIVNQTPDDQDQIADLLAALRRKHEKECVKKGKLRSEKNAVGSDTEPGIAEAVSGLMKACHLLMNEGLQRQAAELARQAYALDPERVGADPLVYKMHLLADSPTPQESNEECEPPSCPYCPQRAEPIREILSEPAGAAEESEEEPLSNVQNWIEALIGDGVGVDGDGGLRLAGEWSIGDDVIHLRYRRGCLTIWKTPDAAKETP